MQNRKYKLALIAKSSTNPVFLAARAGAENAARAAERRSTGCRSRWSG